MTRCTSGVSQSCTHVFQAKFKPECAQRRMDTSCRTIIVRRRVEGEGLVTEEGGGLGLDNINDNVIAIFDSLRARTWSYPGRQCHACCTGRAARYPCRGRPQPGAAPSNEASWQRGCCRALGRELIHIPPRVLEAHEDLRAAKIHLRAGACGKSAAEPQAAIRPQSRIRSPGLCHCPAPAWRPPPAERGGGGVVRCRRHVVCVPLATRSRR